MRDNISSLVNNEFRQATHFERGNAEARCCRARAAKPVAAAERHRDGNNRSHQVPLGRSGSGHRPHSPSSAPSRLTPFSELGCGSAEPKLLLVLSLLFTVVADKAEFSEFLSFKVGNLELDRKAVLFLGFSNYQRII
jgi:hypothetical protein